MSLFEQQESTEVTELFGDREVRWYQSATRNAVHHALSSGKTRPLIVMPTGSGKTVTIAITVADPILKTILNFTEDRNIRVVFVAHLQRLLSQAENTFANASGVDVRVQSAFSEMTKETVDWADIFVLDEAHHEAMMSIQYQLNDIKNKPIIGLTATNNRPDGLLLKFDEEVELMSREQAVEEGWLARTSVWTIVNSSTMCGRVKDANTVDICRRIVKKYQPIMGQGMFFVRRRQEIEELCKHITDMGYTCAGLTDQSPKQIEQILQQYDRGEIQFIINCKKIGEGVDCPDTTSVVLGCTVGSLVDLNQRIGRSSRPNTQSFVFELINPLNPKTLSAVDVVGVPEAHYLVYEDGVTDELHEMVFELEELDQEHQPNALKRYSA